MQLLHSASGYSDFFKSGFRAFTCRVRGPASSSYNYPSDVSTTSLTSKTISYDTIKRRPVSLIVQSTPREKTPRRRSSFLSFSQFDRNSATPSFNETSTISSPRSLLAVNESALQSFDPFCSSSDAASIFIGLTQDDFASDPDEGESCSSFTFSSNRCIIIDANHNPPSISTIFTPILSSSSVIEEDIDLLPSSEVMDFDDEDGYASARTDWRQFHVDVLTDDM